MSGGNKNIIRANVQIEKNSTVGDNSGNSNNVISPKPGSNSRSNVISSNQKILLDSIVGLNSGKIDDNPNGGGNNIGIVGDDKGNNPDVKRTPNPGICKNKFDGSKNKIGGYPIVGDNSGNIGEIDDNPNGRGNNNSPPARFDQKNVIEDKTLIKGNSIVGDNSGNRVKIDDKPNGGGNNNINNLLRAEFNEKNVFKGKTEIRRNSTVGDVSGNKTMNIGEGSAEPYI